MNSSSYPQLDASTWNIDLQELEYNPSKKDLTDAKIHHLLSEELVQPHRRVSGCHFYNFNDLSASKLQQGVLLLDLGAPTAINRKNTVTEFQILNFSRHQNDLP